MTNTLWQKDLFINENIPYIFNREITEYDMSDAGFSLIQEFKLLPEKEIKELQKLGKQQRKVKIGLIQRENDKLKENLKISFQEARKIFINENKLDNNDIISIKKDAIITIKPCYINKLGDYINFRPKHEYSSFILLDKRLELYYSPYVFEVKGIGDDMIKYHEDYMIKFLKTFFRYMENNTSGNTLEFLRRFIDKYKRRELEIGYYRKFNQESDFNIVGDDTTYMQYWEEDKNNVDITYNFYNVLLKLIKIPL